MAQDHDGLLIGIRQSADAGRDEPVASVTGCSGRAGGQQEDGRHPSAQDARHQRGNGVNGCADQPEVGRVSGVQTGQVITVIRWAGCHAASE